MLTGVLAQNAEPAQDALLVYPPFVATSVNGPHLALGVLSAYLKTRGKSVSAWDGNIRFVRGLLDAGRLEAALEEQRDSFLTLDAEPELDWDDYAELKRSAAAFDVAAEIADATRGDNDSAFGVLARILGSLYGDSLSEALRSTDAVVDALKADEPGPALFEEFLASQDAFFARAGRTGLVGINVSFSEQLHFAALIARELWRRLGEKRPLLLIGGTQISLLATSQIKRLLELPFIDGVAVYEGELTLERAITATQAALAAGKPATAADLSEVPNLWTRGRQKLDTFAEAVVPNDLPTPSFEPEDLRLYYAPRVLPVFVTKGCYWGKCTFCDYTKLAAPSSKRWLEREVGKVVADLKVLLADHAVTTFHLISDAVPPRWYRRFADTVIDEKLGLRFFSYLKNERPEVLTQEFFYKLSEAGVKLLICGVESPVDRILNVIEKGTDRSDIEANFRMMSAAGIRAVCNLIPDYPSTRFDEVEESIRFIRENVDYIPMLSCQFFDLSIASAIAGSPEMYDITVEGQSPKGSKHGAHTLSFTHETLSPEQLDWMKTVFPALAGMVARYHETKEPLRALQQPEFDWTKSSFMFRPFARVESHFSNEFAWDDLLVQRAPEKQIWLRQRKLGTEIALPTRLSALVDTMQRRTFVTFDSLLAESGLDRKALTELLSRLTQLGFVEKVLAFGPATLDRELSSLIGRLGPLPAGPPPALETPREPSGKKRRSLTVVGQRKSP
jgi:anaerobic magnesium-protoporphyrin IX monomethyl ester cyclase